MKTAIRHPLGESALDADIDDTVNNPFPEVWRVSSVDTAPAGFIYTSEATSFAGALTLIDQIGGSEADLGPRLSIWVSL